MHKTPVVIDCDPGIDDIAALLLAKHIEAFDIKAITTVAGNVGLENTTRNALQLLSFMGWDLPLGKGAASPLVRSLKTAEDVHGESGMRGLTLPKTDKKPVCDAAWEVLYQAARDNKGQLDIITLGPLTNVAVALTKYPELTDWVRRIVIMGGAFLAGNTTAAAEFNVYVDPEAAKRVFTSGIPFCLCPLDVTHQGYITENELLEIKKLGSKEAQFFSDILYQYIDLGYKQTNNCGVPLHDPLALLFAADSSYFTVKECFIGVETQGSITCGKTITDCYSDKQFDNNGFYVQTVDRGAFIGHIMRLLSLY